MAFYNQLVKYFLADEIHSSGSGRFQHHEVDMFVFSRKQSDLLVMDFPAQGMLKAALTALALALSSHLRPEPLLGAVRISRADGRHPDLSGTD